MKAILEELDVDVIDRDMLDDEHARQFRGRWLVQYPDGKIMQFCNEDAACEYQRNHRVSLGYHPMERA